MRLVNKHKLFKSYREAHRDFKLEQLVKKKQVKVVPIKPQGAPSIIVRRNKVK